MGTTICIWSAGAVVIQFEFLIRQLAAIVSSPLPGTVEKENDRIFVGGIVICRFEQPVGQDARRIRVRSRKKVIYSDSDRSCWNEVYNHNQAN